MNFYKISYIILTVISAVTVGLTIADSIIGNGESGIFSSAWIVLILTAYVALQIVCLIHMKPAFSLRRIGFYALHAGIVLFLVGSFVYYISGDMLYVTVPVDETATYSKVQRSDAEGNVSEDYTDLGFGMGVSAFRVEKYAATDKLPESDKYYEASLLIRNQTSLLVSNKKITVNHPVRENGWKIYLMSFEGTGDDTKVLFMLKRDGGEWISVAGICLLMAGSFLMCIRREKGGNVR